MHEEKTFTPNENCLEGMRCPECGSYEPFRMAVTCLMTVTDDGTDEPEGAEWSKDSYCCCLECKYEGAVQDFRMSDDERVAEDQFKCHECGEWCDIEDSYKYDDYEDSNLYCPNCTVEAGCGCVVPKRLVITHDGVTCCPVCYERIK